MKEEPVKIQITDEEWANYPEEKKKRIKSLIAEYYGWDIASLISLDEDDGMICPYCKDHGCGVCLDLEEGHPWNQG